MSDLAVNEGDEDLHNVDTLFCAPPLQAGHTISQPNLAWPNNQTLAQGRGAEGRSDLLLPGQPQPYHHEVSDGTSAHLHLVICTKVS